jgi:L-ascorbate metabolism protein UlaG (beta-lactamase superfamily)
MKIKYIDHSGFVVESADCAIMIDCCGLTKDSPDVRAYDGKRLYILASHAHGDHFDPAILSFGGDKRKWILSDDITGSSAKGAAALDTVFLAKGAVYRDQWLMVKAFGSTDAGISFYIECGGKKIFHAGDLNNWHWNEEETPEDAAKNERWFLDELAEAAKEIPALDAAMFPVDPRLGKDYMRGAGQFLDAIKVGLFIPMHFAHNVQAAAAFKPEADRRGSRFAAISSGGDVFEV